MNPSWKRSVIGSERSLIMVKRGVRLWSKILIIAIISSILLVMTCLFIIGLIGVGPGRADYSYDLPGGYILVRSSAHEISIIPKDGYDPQKPPPLIPAKVVEVAFDNRYILSKRYELIPDPKLNNGYKIPDDTKELYYVFDTSSQKIHVYSNVNEFYKGREELHVPTNLILKDVQDGASLN